jgi:AraC-like DNA-binding protein
MARGLPLQVPPTIATYAPRDRTREMLRAAFPRRRGRVVITRSATDLARTLRTTLVDAVVVDLGGAQPETWTAAALARDFPATPFIGATTLRASEGAAVAHCATLEFADLLVDAVDDGVARDLLHRTSYTGRFTRALAEPPAQLELESELQRAAWGVVVAHAGRPVQTAAVADALGVTREHLSRSFAVNDGPNLKRVIDLVRIIAAAELAKNPGYDLRDVAAVLAFASPSHLSTTSQRIAGTRATSLARLRTVDVIDRFARGHARSRG